MSKQNLAFVVNAEPSIITDIVRDLHDMKDAGEITIINYKKDYYKKFRIISYK